MTTLLFLVASDFVLIERGRPLRVEPSIVTPSGIHHFIHDSSRGLLKAAPTDRVRFHAWLQSRGLTAVRAQEDRQQLPIVVARGRAEALRHYGRVEGTSVDGLYRIHLGPGIVDPAGVAARMQAEGIAAAEPDEWWQMSAREALNDTFYSPLWHLHPSRDAAAAPAASIRADEAWDVSKGNGTVIAVGDDGFSMVHPDLIPTYFYGLDARRAARDFVDGDEDPSPHAGDGHGTRVLGAAAARGNNHVGTTGACPECRTIPMRVFTSNGAEYDENRLLGQASVVAEAFRWAAQRGARIINSSWGPAFNERNPVYRGMPGFVSDAITELVRQGPADRPGQRGVLFVWAAGNQSRLVISYDGWASDPRVFAVGALNARAELATGCVIGAPMELLAPSADPGGQLPKIITTDLENGYSFNFTGTSAAAPIAAGAAALVLGAFPDLSLAQLFEVLLDSAARVDVGHARYSRRGESCTHGAGRIDARAALELAAARQAQYAGGFTLHFELCGDGIDNDNNPATDDSTGACQRCIPSGPREVASNGVDDDCDGYVDNPAPCVPSGSPRCGACAADGECQPDLVCMLRSDGQRCLRSCVSDPTCAPGEQCTEGVCLPVRAGEAVECAVFSACAPSNGGMETCDGVDNDCNGSVDDVADMAQEALVARQHCLEGAVGVCTERSVTCEAGYWTCKPAPQYQPVDDSCDGLDNNCDGSIDEAAANCPTAPPVERPKQEDPPRGGCASSAPCWVAVFGAFAVRRRRLPSSRA